MRTFYSEAKNLNYFSFVFGINRKKLFFYRKSSVIYIAGAIIEARIGLTRTLFNFQYLFSKKLWG